MTPGGLRVTFMTQAEARGLVDECVMAACVSAVEGHDNAAIADAFLEHGEQRFRLSYVLGAWRREAPGDAGTDAIDLDYEPPDDTEQYGDEEVQAREVVGGDDVVGNNRRLEEYVGRIRDISNEIGAAITAARGSVEALENPYDRQEWRDGFAGALTESDIFANLSLDVMDDLLARFDAVGDGEFRRRTSAWPEVWHYENSDRETFLAQVRWFTSNHYRRFGRLLTPLVDGIRVRGPFHPALSELRDRERRLVPRSNKERQEAIGEIRRQVFERIHALVVDRLIVEHPDDWRRALSFSGRGSSDLRAREMKTIYDAAAPSISSVMDPEDRKFLDEVIRIVGDVITTAGGTLEGAGQEGLSDRKEGHA